MDLHSIFLFLQGQGLLNHLYPLFRKGLCAVYAQQSLLQDPLKASREMDVESFKKYLLTQNPQVFDLLKKADSKIKLIDEQKRYQQQKGIETILWGEPEYPGGFYPLSDAPLLISVLGVPCWGSNHVFSVVGSRDPTLETRQWIEFHLSHFLKSTQFVVVSGGARGVDQLAHNAALRLGLPTMAILPSGLGRIYPLHFSEFAQDIAQSGGCVMSEYPHRMPMNKGHFHHRNRLIAAMGLGTLILQANLKSGTMITANHAAQLGQPVWVVPGHPMDERSAGSLKLISEGATMVRDALDLVMYCQAESLSNTRSCTYVDYM